MLKAYTRTPFLVLFLANVRSNIYWVRGMVAVWQVGLNMRRVKLFVFQWKRRTKARPWAPLAHVVWTQHPFPGICCIGGFLKWVLKVLPPVNHPCYFWICEWIFHWSHPAGVSLMETWGFLQGFQLAEFRQMHPTLGTSRQFAWLHDVACASIGTDDECTWCWYAYRHVVLQSSLNLDFLPCTTDVHSICQQCLNTCVFIWCGCCV